jgi:8-oxo-dGTP pyrophosphatase MutT (NUDIX family)
MSVRPQKRVSKGYLHVHCWIYGAVSSVFVRWFRFNIFHSGESMEDAVVREVKEESDIDVDVHSVEYFASQPWPFGGQLMLGCFARAT